jgi:hypothetical protein
LGIPQVFIFVINLLKQRVRVLEKLSRREGTQFNTTYITNPSKEEQEMIAGAL